ncbi:16S rRNA (uracil(1498)-N(3))-methyltransferase [Microvirga sp. W0021]|uniref:Ribosomal RNA small subunit methyltransferase E n=1 Tax=Hohaiivirga grylli TaxID=3133970 RepID=A0ABV0BI29_9HYPH
MSQYDFNAPRLFLNEELAKGRSYELDRAQSNYLLNVLRLKAGSNVLVFNGRDGEWKAEISVEGRKSASLLTVELARPQTAAADLLYMFAPIKHARQDYMVQKAVEMGISAMMPVFTQRTQSGRVNLERMQANAVEAAEQCGILVIPEIKPEMKLAAALDALEEDRLLIFCDEDASVQNPVEALKAISGNKHRLAVLIGPEGGFSESEREMIKARKPCLSLSLGPRILRADTAAVAALAVIQASIGDWG